MEHPNPGAPFYYNFKGGVDMATHEHIGLQTYKDSNGEKHLLYPVVKAECIADPENIPGFATELELQNVENKIPSVLDENGKLLTSVLPEGYPSMDFGDVFPTAEVVFNKQGYVTSAELSLSNTVDVGSEMDIIVNGISYSGTIEASDFISGMIPYLLVNDGEPVLISLTDDNGNLTGEFVVGFANNDFSRLFLMAAGVAMTITGTTVQVRSKCVVRMSGKYAPKFYVTFFFNDQLASRSVKEIATWLKNGYDVVGKYEFDDYVLRVEKYVCNDSEEYYFVSFSGTFTLDGIIYGMRYVMDNDGYNYVEESFNFNPDDAAYTHPSHTAKESGFYKFAVDGEGHVAQTSAVTKEDIVGFGVDYEDLTDKHFSETNRTLTTIVSETSNLNPTFTLETGATYIITFNDVEYEYVASEVPGYGWIGIGNPGIIFSNNTKDDGCPIALIYNPADGSSMANTTSTGSYTYSVVKVESDITKLPNRFLDTDWNAKIDRYIDKVLLAQTSFDTGTSSYAYDLWLPTEDPRDYSSVIVTFDGTDYELQMFGELMGDPTDWAFGSMSGTGVPFMFQANSSESRLSVAEPGAHTIKIVGRKPVVEKLPEFYIPETIARTSDAYVHPTTAGNKHIPSGGSANQILAYSSNGTAAWSKVTDVGAAPAYTYGTADLTAGTSELTTGTLYFVYE